MQSYQFKLIKKYILGPEKMLAGQINKKVWKCDKMSYEILLI